MRKLAIGAASALLVAACSAPEVAETPRQVASKPLSLISGVTLENFDRSVDPGDDFYRYVNGSWLAETDIPADKSNYGSFTKLADDAEKHLLTIIKEAAEDKNKADGSDEQKVGDLYASFMDAEALNKAGLAPLKPVLAIADGLKSKRDLPAMMGKLERINASTPVGGFINQDAKDPDTYTVYAFQSGLGLPDRDYYLEDTEKFSGLREKYVAHIETMLDMAGYANAGRKAAAIMAFETELAKVSWTRVDSRDSDKTYNKYAIADLGKLMKHFDLAAYLQAVGVRNIDSIIVAQPSFFEGLDKAFADTDIGTLRAYFAWHLISDFAAFLSEDFVDADFAFYGKELRGVTENRPRWKRGVALVEASLGEVLGRIYVERHFPPQAKAKMDVLVKNLIEAYRVSIQDLDWMTEETKAQAYDKLDSFTVKIGYPDKWKDYSKLTIKPGDLMGNVLRAREVAVQRELDKLGSEIDRGEWYMTPQTVNAYYNPVANEIVFPAAILQPPFFNFKAEPAVNYGGIGAVIGHEIGHGFDDQGSKYDGKGRLRNWWTDTDRKNFEARTGALIEQYNGYCPLGDDQPCVSGELTIGENIGDLGGLSIAFKAYQMSLAGRTSPVLDGFTGEQRVFIGWAAVWRRLYRDAELLNRLKTDPHSPSEYRTNGIVRNIPEWYEAFSVGLSDDLYLNKEDRVKIW